MAATAGGFSAEAHERRSTARDPARCLLPATVPIDPHPPTHPPSHTLALRHAHHHAQEFLYCASRGDTSRLRTFLNQGFDPDAADYDGRTALMLACVKGFREAVQLLLEAGAAVNAQDAFGGTPMCACAVC